VGKAVKLSGEKLVAEESCHRRMLWTDRYVALRISLVRALYIALDAGLRAEKDPEKAAENQFLALAARPGLDIEGSDVYAVAMHHAKLAGIIAAALRSTTSRPWSPVANVALGEHSWASACYRLDGLKEIYRIALVDRWSDDRREQELYGWRTLGETVALNQPILLTAVTIGSAQNKRRHSPWTRCYRHPRNRTYRMKRKNSEEDFSQTWTRVWREDSGIPTAKWLDQMKADGCMEDLVHTVLMPVPVRRSDYLVQIERLAGEMGREDDSPRFADCFGWSPCPFHMVCHGAREPAVPDSYGFRLAEPRR
jgi:hypothetical protein